jgi:hypothetical protein
MTDSFTLHHLRFMAEVETAIEMDAFKGSALRGAWQSHLRTLYCARTDERDPLHQALCPVCFLLSRETGGGDDRRPYAFAPPLAHQTRFEPGERFTFGISLFGQTVQFLPYLVLAVGQMGRAQGLGRPIHFGNQRISESATRSLRQSPGGRQGEEPRRRGGDGGTRRGTFRLVRIEEANPLTGERRALLEEGGSLVHMPALPVDAGQVAEAAGRLAQALAATGGRLEVEYLTPTRIVHRERLAHRPEFSPMFARLLDRVSALRCQFAGGEPLPGEEKARLLSVADRVRLAEDGTGWWDLRGYSARLGQPQPLGGFVGRAVYAADDPETWRPLLPWLLWGQSTQVGKNVVKGCGWYEVRISEEGNQRIGESANRGISEEGNQRISEAGNQRISEAGK